MGVVYEGQHITIGRKVAIKLIREEYARAPHARGLLTEARAASSIRHHGIIDIFGFGQQPGVGQYLVMEYLEGSPLDAVIKERAPLALAEAIPMLCEMLDALSAAHAAGVIHRDLKPSNIFVVRASSGAEYIKVLDFGLATRTDVPNGSTPQTHSNLIVGTPQYMAPEQALGAEVGPRTDLYAMGVIAFELLTGRRPFSGRSQMEVVVHHLQSLPPAPASFVPLPNEINELILRLLAKAPQDRPASAREVARELRTLLKPREEGTPLLSSSLPGVRSNYEVERADAPTATVPPLAALALAAGQVPVRSPLWRRWRKWGLVAGGCLALALGAGVVKRRGGAEPVAAAPPPAWVEDFPAPAKQESQSQASTSAAAPELPPVPAPMPADPRTRVKRAPPPAKKKTPKSVPTATITAFPPPNESTSLVAELATEAVLNFTPNESTSPVAERATEGVLNLTVHGTWAYVWVDGKEIGRVPQKNEYSLAAGVRELELRHPNLGLYRRKIVIPPGGTYEHTVDLRNAVQDSTMPFP
jgi:serine/threonine-protein kinase